jgi:hypothetical protein
MNLAQKSRTSNLADLSATAADLSADLGFGGHECVVKTINYFLDLESLFRVWIREWELGKAAAESDE